MSYNPVSTILTDIPGALNVQETATPSTLPNSGYDLLYFKSDHNLYSLSNSGIETQINGPSITALTGDATASGPGSATLTLATVNSNVGSFGSPSSVSSLTVNAKGLITAASSTSIQITESQVTNLISDLASKQPVGNYITALSGDVTASGPGSAVSTLATVNSNVGSFTYSNITVNAKGLITAVSNGTGIANQQLSNLVGPTAINASLRFGTDNAMTIGQSAGSRPSFVYAGTGMGIGNAPTVGGTPEEGFLFAGQHPTMISFIGADIAAAPFAGQIGFFDNNNNVLMQWTMVTGESSMYLVGYGSLLKFANIGTPQSSNPQRLDILWNTDNAGSNIGAPTTSRPSNIYVAQTINAGGNITSGATISSTAGSIISGKYIGEPTANITITNGGSTTLTTDTTLFVITGAGTIATYGITAPSNRIDGQTIRILVNGQVSSLTLTPGAGDNVLNGTALNVGSVGTSFSASWTFALTGGGNGYWARNY